MEHVRDLILLQPATRSMKLTTNKQTLFLSETFYLQYLNLAVSLKIPAYEVIEGQ